MPAVQEHTAGSDKSSAPAERGWAYRIRVPCLLLRDERDLAGEKGKPTIDAMALSSGGRTTVHSGAEQKLKTSFEPLPKEAPLTAISARIAPIPPIPRRPVCLARPRICGVLFL